MAFLGIPTSRKDLGNAGWIKGAATTGARVLANAGQITGGAGTGTTNLRSFADAIDDPTKGYAGAINPLAVVNGINNPSTTAFRFTSAPAAGGGAPGGANGGQDPNAFNVNGGAGSYGAGGTYDENTDPTKIAQKRDQVRGLMGAFQDAFEDVLRRVDAMAAEKRGSFEKSYTDQQTGLDKNFGATTTGIDDQYSARNAYHSSYRENAQQQAKDAYDSATQQLGTAKGNDLASVGKFVDEQRASLNSSRPNYNLDEYGEVDDLMEVQRNVDEALNKIRETGAGLGSNSEYMQRLNSIAPTQETGSAALKAQLDKLVNVGTNPDAKRAIAMTTIANAGGDQTAWIDYFEKQLQQTGSGAVTSPANVQLQA